MIELQNFEKSIGARTLYKDVNLIIKDQVSILVGPNGSGKTTLFNCLAGVDNDYIGGISFNRKTPLIGYMEQEVAVDCNDGVIDFIRNKIGINQLEDEMNELYTKMSDKNENQNVIFERLGDVQERFESLEGYIIDDKIEATLMSLGFTREELGRKMSELSGGQKRKILLTSVLLKGIDLALLDEPTNDLDAQSVYNLINYINTRVGALLVISHDVNLLDSISHNIIEIDPLKQSIETYSCIFSEYRNEKEKRLNQALGAYEKQQEEKSRLNKLLQEEKNSTHKKAPESKDNNKGAYNKAREKCEDGAGKRINVIKQRIEQANLEKPIRKKPLRFELGVADMARGEITMKNVTFSYDNSPFSVIISDFKLRAGGKTILLGNNGSGKSTLIKILSGELEASAGEINKNSSFRFGLFNQSHLDLIESNNAMEYIEKNIISKGTTKQDILQALAKFEIKAENVTKPINLLSPGERARVILSLFNLNKYNTLILDEPTNHLDIEAVEELIRTLNEFKGTALIVSHDVNFVRSLENCEFYLADNGKIKEIESFDEYLSRFKLP